MCARQFHAGAFPLWNHLNAFGSPFCGDLNATVLSPLRWLFDLVPNAYTYNLQLVLQVIICALGTFALTRTLGSSRLASVFAAITFALCPFMLWYLELQSGVAFVLYPGVLWLFARAAKTARSGDAIFAGVASGVSLLIGHPEPAFFGTAIAASLMALIAVRAHGWLRFVRLLAVAAVSAVCIAAPVLFPFLEFMRNADCYKFGVGKSVSLPWQALAYNLLSPAAGGASPFLGVLTLPLVPLSLLGSDGRKPVTAGWQPALLCNGARQPALCVAVIGLLALIPAANLWPFSLLSQIPPFSYLVTVYFVPIVLLAIAVLAAIGLTNLTDVFDRNDAETPPLQRRAVPVLPVMAIGLLLAVAVPWTLHARHFNLAITNFDLQLPDAAFNVKGWQRDAVIGGIFVVVVFALFWWARRTKGGLKPAGTIAAALIILMLNFVSVASVAKSSLPICPSFTFPELPVTTFLKQSRERCLATTAHILKPNVNIMYGIEDARSMNVMWPKRYLKFVTACGATVDQYSQVYSGALSSLLDLGSVKYVLSQSPVLCKEDPSPPNNPLDLVSYPLLLDDNLSLSDGEFWTDEANAAAGGYLKFVQSADALRASKMRLIFVLKNAGGDVVWFSDRLTPLEAQTFTLPLPVRAQQICKLYLRLFDSSSGRFCSIAGEEELPLTSVGTAPRVAHVSNPHFVLDRSFADTQVRLYRNTGSLPHAYVCFNPIMVSDEKQAFQLITSPSFDAHTQVALEPGTEPMTLPSPTQQTNVGIVRANIVQRRSAQTMIEYFSRDVGWLVLTDTYYPGWNAYLDGKRVPLVRANYLFRAISAPAGAHRVLFRYEPVSFYAGLLTAVSFIIVLLSRALLRMRKRDRSTAS